MFFHYYADMSEVHNPLQVLSPAALDGKLSSSWFLTEVYKLHFMLARKVFNHSWEEFYDRIKSACETSSDAGWWKVFDLNDVIFPSNWILRIWDQKIFASLKTLLMSNHKIKDTLERHESSRLPSYFHSESQFAATMLVIIICDRVE